MELKVQEDLGSGRHLFSGSLVIDRSGSFGYTVRVLPRHDALASKAELGTDRQRVRPKPGPRRAERSRRNP
jgi:hypothetical protein